MNPTVTIQFVNGGFIVIDQDNTFNSTTEVFSSQSKLIKALKTLVEKNSLVGKDKADEA